MARIDKVVVNYMYNTAYELVRILAPLITVPYVSRVLGAVGIGTYSYSQSIATYFILFASMGTGLYAQREIAYAQDDAEKRSRTFWEIEVFSSCTALMSSLCFYLIFARDGDNSVIFKILTLEVIANAFDISWLFKGMEDFKIIVIRNTLVRFAGIILVFIFVKTPVDVPLYTFCVTFPTLLGNISLWFSIKKYVIKVKGNIISGISRQIKPILLLFIPQVAVEIYAVLDKTMIGVLSADMSQVGYYTQAQKIIKIILLIVTSLGTVMLPAMSATFSKGECDKIVEMIRSAFNFVFMISFALMFGLWGVCSRFVPLFFGDNFDLVCPLMVTISPILVVIGISNVIGRQYLLPTKRQSLYTISVIVGAVVNLILNLILIPKYNAIGASIATVFAELSVTAIQMWYVRHQLPLKDCFMSMTKYLMMGLIMFIAVYGIGRILPGGILYLIILVLVGMIVYGVELYIARDEVFIWLRKIVRSL